MRAVVETVPTDLSFGESIALKLGFGRKAETARKLSALDDHMLRDIGLTRTEVELMNGAIFPLLR